MGVGANNGGYGGTRGAEQVISVSETGSIHKMSARRALKAICAAALACACLPPPTAHAVTVRPPVMADVNLAPHRAIYDMVLGETRAASGVRGVAGRMVFEFKGSECDGYSLNVRLVTQVTDSQGQSTLTDLRSSSWEEGNGHKFKFNSKEFLNQKLNEETDGRAERAGPRAPISVNLSEPDKEVLSFPDGVLFPTQHSRALLDAAEGGETVLQARVYDGSEKGRRVYETTSFIGKKAAPENRKLEPAAAKGGLDKLASWPVSIGYFEPGKPDMTAPAYQLDFWLYANGVSRKLLINYGEFSINGTLRELEYLKAKPCG